MPVKVICSQNVDVIDKAIEGANKQNPLDEFAFLSRKPFVKRLEQHCSALHKPSERIHLARQESQWAGAIAQGVVSRDRVIALVPLLRSVAVLAREPHQVQSAEKRQIDRWVIDRELLAAEHSISVYHLAGLAVCLCRSSLGFDEWERKYGAKYHLIYVLLNILADRAKVQLNTRTTDFDVNKARAIFVGSSQESLIRDAFSIISAVHKLFMPENTLSVASKYHGFTHETKNKLRQYLKNGALHD